MENWSYINMPSQAMILCTSSPSFEPARTLSPKPKPMSHQQDCTCMLWAGQFTICFPSQVLDPKLLTDWLWLTAYGPEPGNLNFNPKF